MTRGRRVAAIVHAVVLALGALLAAWAAARSLHLLGAEPLAYSLRRGCPGVVLLALTGAHAWIFRVRGSSVVSALAYVGSYVVLGVYLNVTIGMMTKDYAPATEEEAAAAREHDILVTGALTAGVGWVAWRRGRVAGR